jgi:hypothetical protein
MTSQFQPRTEIDCELENSRRLIAWSNHRDVCSGITQKMGGHCGDLSLHYWLWIRQGQYPGVVPGSTLGADRAGEFGGGKEEERLRRDGEVSEETAKIDVRRLVGAGQYGSSLVRLTRRNQRKERKDRVLRRRAREGIRGTNLSYNSLSHSRAYCGA